jgi:hypothetical protein
MMRFTWILTLLLPGVSIGCSPNGNAPDAGADSPKDAVALYLRAMAGEVPLEEVVEVLDWESLKKAAEATRPKVRFASMDRFRKELLARLKAHVGQITPERLAETLPRLQVEEERDQATVTNPDREGASFTLRRIAAGWVISGLPENG